MLYAACVTSLLWEARLRCREPFVEALTLKERLTETTRAHAVADARWRTEGSGVRCVGVLRGDGGDVLMEGGAVPEVW